MSKLKRGQIIIIEGIRYIVVNMIEFQEGLDVWQEYEVKKQIISEKPMYGESFWLSVEKNELKKTEYYLYDTYSGWVSTNSTTIMYNDKSYSLSGSGTATVKSYFGNADVDLLEKCQYYDYASADKEEIISVEIWEGETERTIGRKISDNQIQITNEIDKDFLKNRSYYKGNKNYLQSILITLFVLALVLAPIFGTLIDWIFVNKSIQKYIENNTSKYTYVTSVTNNSNNHKAKVYVTKFTTLDQAVKDIINGVPEGITETIDDDSSTEKDGYGLETDNEYAYIYLNKDNLIYVQVSEKEYVNNSGTTYHSSYNSYYHRSFTRRHRNYSYYNYASSARQASINSRLTSGGGTSSGK